ncbi:MAG: PQQ-dependent sugar dehydrogenase [Actinomycetota bacterium]
MFRDATREAVPAVSRSSRLLVVTATLLAACAAGALAVAALVPAGSTIENDALAPVDTEVLDQFQRVPIVTDLANALDFEFLPDGRILILNRYGIVTLFDPATQSTVEAASIPVHISYEAGLLGVEPDPDFATNNHIYLYYSPGEAGAPDIHRLSRFTMVGNTIDLTSEISMLEIPASRGERHHEGGNLEFDAQGNLYVGTGDNTFHSPYAALNENKSDKSAEKSAANTMDLRGKILRIHPEDDGTYTIPSGNLFTNPALGAPEVYVMGARNPFKFEIDPETGWVFWGDVGPDANFPGQNGPAGLDEINLTMGPGNWGWPHFIGDNLPYRNTYLDYFFDPLLPTNDSRWNTGPRELPPAIGSWLSFEGEAYMAGPVYHYDETVSNPSKLPVDLDGRFFYWDFNRSLIWVVEFDTATGAIISNQPWTALDQLGMGYIDMEIGPDHQLYVLEYGTGCCAADVGNGVLARYDYTGSGGGQSPVAEMSSDVRSGQLPLQVNFSSAGSYDPDGGAVTFAWDFTTDGTIDATTPDASYTYTSEGTYNAQLRVTDPDGNVSFANTTIYAGNTIADVQFTLPIEGALFDWQEFVDIDVSVDDAEDGSTGDGSIPCSSVLVTPALGHLDHTHDEPPLFNCQGPIQFFSDHDNDGADDLYFQLLARYTDGNGLDSFKQILLFPKLTAAVFADQFSGTQQVDNTDTRFNNLHALRVLDDDGYFVLEGRNLTSIDGVQLGVASGLTGTSIEVRAGSPTGTLVATLNVPDTGGFDTWTTVSSSITDPGGLNDLYFVVDGDAGQLNQLSVSSIEFTGDGVSYRTPAELTTIEVSPATARLLPGETQTFTATTLDQYGEPFPGSVTWSSDAGGTIDANGLFTAQTAGTTPTVTATSGSITGTARVTIPLQPEILFVTGSGASMPTADQRVMDELLTFSSAVTVVDDDVVTEADGEVRDLIVISTSVDPGKLDGMFVTTPVPIITWEIFLYQSLGMTAGGSSNRGEAGDFTSVIITDPTHPLAGGLSGTVGISSATAFSWGEPTADADVVATLPNGQHPVIFAYEKHDIMADGSAAPAARIGTFPSFSTPTKWNGSGVDLFNAGPVWAIATNAPALNQPPTVDAGPDASTTANTPLALAGSFSDDGLPVGETTTATWTASGPAAVTFVDDTDPTTSATFPLNGTYTLTLAATDTELTSQDTVTITVSDTPPPPVDPEVLFVSRKASAPPGPDQAIIDLLLTRTPNVTVVDDNDVTEGDADGKDLIVIPSTVIAGNVDGLFATAAVPVIIWEPFAFPGLGMTGNDSGDRGQTGSFSTITITDPGHPLAGGLTGEPQILTSNAAMTFGQPAPAAQIVATLPTNATPVVWMYDTGAVMANGLPAPAPRIGLPFNYGAPGKLTTSGENLFLAAYDAALVPAGPPTNQAPTVDAGADASTATNAPLTLGGSFGDDGLPAGETTTVLWTASGPAPVTFSDDTDPTTTATFTQEGSYTLTLTADDTELTSQDTVTITVSDAPPPPVDHEVLFVSRKASAPPAPDQAIIDLLLTRTPNVTVVDDNDVTTADADGKDLIVIPSTVIAGNVDGVFTDTAVPLIVWEPFAYPGLGLTGNTSSDRGQTGSFSTITIADPSHPLAGGLSGEPTILTSNASMTFGQPSAAAQIVATLPTGDTPVAWIYEAGAIMANGQPAPATRIGLPFNYSSPNKLTGDGEALFLGAYDSAMIPAGPPTNQAPSVEAGPDASTQTGVALALQGSVSDDGLPTGQTVTSTWTSSGPAPVTFADDTDPTTTATFTQDGSYTLTLTADDTELNAQDTVTVTVEDLVLTTIVVTPPSTTIEPSGTADFTAEGRDQNGDPIAASITWGVSGGGTMSGTGTFTSDGSEGAFTVTASDGGVQGTAQVVVASGPGILGLDSWTRHLLDGNQPRRAPLIDSADVDGDGRPDLIAGGYWYANPGTASGTWVRTAIGGGLNTMAHVFDADGDGDPDILGTTGSYVGTELVWAENDGTGSFTVHTNVDDGTSTHNEAFVADSAGADFGGTSDYQIAMTWNGGETGSSGVQLLTVPDTNPTVNQWTIETIHPDSEGEALTAGDIDGDGRLDLFQGTRWLRNNPDGSWTQFVAATFPGLGDIDRSRLGDFDGDGDLDAAVGFLNQNTPLIWLENPADPTQTWTQHTIDTDTEGGLSLSVADVDNDGDPDIILGEHRWPKQIQVFENVDDATSWTAHEVWHGGPIDHHDGNLMVDVDGDGDLDIFSLGWKKLGIYIYENNAIS